jgi:hypothetical protein
LPQTTRQIVRNGIAQFFGGTAYDQEARAYRGAGPLASAGLSTVRAYQPKRMSDVDYVYGQAAGRGMGAAMVVELPSDVESRDAKPAGTGRKRINYTVILHCFHLAYQSHAEDAGPDVDSLIEQIKGLIRQDVTLGGVCFQAGESRFHIKTRIYPSAIIDKEKIATAFDIQFEAETEIIG